MCNLMVKWWVTFSVRAEIFLSKIFWIGCENYFIFICMYFWQFDGAGAGTLYFSFLPFTIHSIKFNSSFLDSQAIFETTTFWTHYLPFY